jgi:hypothetical protein
MKPITKEMMKSLSVSTIVLGFFSIAVFLGVFLLVLTVVDALTWEKFFDLMAIAVLGIAVYYFAFGVLAKLFIQKKQVA